jgi:hypothetical protein
VIRTASNPELFRHLVRMWLVAFETETVRELAVILRKRLKF